MMKYMQLIQQLAITIDIIGNGNKDDISGSLVNS